MSIASIHSAKALREEWLTPPEILEALGPFDLDPCASQSKPHWTPAFAVWTILDDGLTRPWWGRVWLNPPYGKKTDRWLARLADHDDGIALIFARTETAMFFDQVWSKATALLFLKGRLHFYHPDGRKARANAGGPSVLVAYGEECADILDTCTIAGHYVRLR